MPESQVACLICGHRASTLARHLKPAHGITADAYRERFPGARIRSEVCEANRRAAIAKAHKEKPRKGQKKTLVCPCGATYEVGRTSASKDPRCSDCRARDKAAQEIARWEGKTEGLDYVVCLECGHRAESLVSHIRSVHPNLEGHYPGQMTADCSAVRDKTALKGKKLSDETRSKMSASAGWNRGLTKETDERVARAAKAMVGRRAWRKGTTKEDHPGVLSTSVKMQAVRAQKYWTNGNEVLLTPAQLEPFKLKNGKVSVGKAMAVLGHAFVTIRKECRRHGLPVAHTNVAEHFVVEAISQLLGGAKYKPEWSSPRFVNPATGRRFRYDAFFPDHKLLVEFHGRQHWEPVGFYEKNGEKFEALQARDALKATLAQAARIPLLVVREDEPWQDLEHLRTGLAGVISLCAR